jgi:hypothetical protein
MRASEPGAALAAAGAALACVLFACSSGARHTVSDDAGGSDASDESETSIPQVACPNQEAETSLPSGSCSGAGACAFEVTPVCKPGVRFIDVAPPTYSCDCDSGAWACTLLSGGLGVVPCPDAGADASASPDASPESGALPEAGQQDGSADATNEARPAVDASGNLGSYRSMAYAPEATACDNVAAMVLLEHGLASS